MGKRNSGQYRGWLLALGLVPGFFLMEHVGPTGFPVAEGCSGSGVGGGSSATAPPPSVTIERDLTAEKAAVATDGFFLLHLERVFDAKDISVAVTDEAGMPIAGKVKNWRLGLTDGKVYAPSDEVGLQQVNDYWGWEADQPLKIGTKIKAAVGLKSESAPMDSLELEVVGEPSALAAGKDLVFSDWLDFGHGVGDQVKCEVFQGCSRSTVSVPSSEELLHATRATWAGPQNIHGTVLWAATLEVSSGNQLFTSFPVANDETGLFPLFGAVSQPMRLGMVVFPKDAQKYCATLVLRDLRTGKEVKAEHCEDAPGKSTSAVHDFTLGQCLAPPSAALTEAWCKLHPGSDLPACTGAKHPVDPVVTPEDDDEKEDDDGDVVAKPPISNPTKGDMNAADDTQHNSSGCHTSLGKTSGAGVTFALGFVAAAVSLLRRRRGA